AGGRRAGTAAEPTETVAANRVEKGRGRRAGQEGRRRLVPAEAPHIGIAHEPRRGDAVEPGVEPGPPPGRTAPPPPPGPAPPAPRGPPLLVPGMRDPPPQRRDVWQPLARRIE